MSPDTQILKQETSSAGSGPADILQTWSEPLDLWVWAPNVACLSTRGSCNEISESVTPLIYTNTEELSLNAQHTLYLNRQVLTRVIKPVKWECVREKCTISLRHTHAGWKACVWVWVLQWQQVMLIVIPLSAINNIQTPETRPSAENTADPQTVQYSDGFHQVQLHTSFVFFCPQQ